MSRYIAEKYDENENINVGDILMYAANTDCVTKARYKRNESVDSNKIIGICIAINDTKTITYTNCGIVDVNVKGLVCLGDKLTISEYPGIAIAIKYTQDDTIFGIKGIGKVIGLYNTYSKVKVMLDIE